jgi:translation initiation factor IF-2
MAEYRLAKVAGELNRSFTALAEFLKQKGFDVEARPTTKINEDMYQSCLQEFSADKAAKDEANKLKNQKVVRITTTPTTEKVAVDETPTVVTPVNPPVTKAEPVNSQPEEPIKMELPKVEEVADVKNVAITEETPIDSSNKKEEQVGGLKILGKIELHEKPKKPKYNDQKPQQQENQKPKQQETPPPVKKEEKVEPVAKIESIQKPEPVIEKIVEEKKVEEISKEIEKPTVETHDKVIEEIEIEKIVTRRETLSGPRVLGTIQLQIPKQGVSSLANDAKKDVKEERKKRKRKDTPGTVKVAVQETIKTDDKFKPAFQKAKPPVKTEVSQSAVKSNVKNTMGKMGNAGKSRGDKFKKKANDKDRRRGEQEEERRRKIEDSKTLRVTEFLAANELASMMNVPVTQVISKCFSLGLMVSINQRLDAETIQLVANDFNFEIEFVDAETQIEAVDDEKENPEDICPRAPIVTVMGHVDHGKTSLLDYIRKENVIAGEAGGITQHIGAYEVTLQDGRKITFLDTPGHEAFTAMRARGAKVTDMAIIVIAADDSVMPQTREAIAHAQAAGVPMVFAFNKMDKDGANPERIREQLAQMNILVEDWGGKFQAQEISAKKGLNVDKLLEKVLLEAELMELTANPKRRAKGTVVEATQEKGRGIVCSMLVQTGTLRVGDHVVAGPHYAKVRALFNERGMKIDNAPPSTPVKLLGFSEPPTAGDTWTVFAEESDAKSLANKRQQLVREQGMRTKRHITLDEIGRRLAVGNFKELKLIVKGDVDGSVEALTDSLMKLSTEEIAINVIHSGVGQITESDVLLASASDAIIVGFQVRPSAKARQIAENEEIDIRTYSIIYQAIEEIKSAMEGMLSPEVIEKIIGTVEVRDVFKISKVGTIAGAYVTDGKIERKSKLRVIRDGVVMHDGELSSLKRFKDDVREVLKGFECGLQIERFNDIEVGDYLEVYKQEEVKRKL